MTFPHVCAGDGCRVCWWESDERKQLTVPVPDVALPERLVAVASRPNDEIAERRKSPTGERGHQPELLAREYYWCDACGRTTTRRRGLCITCRGPVQIVVKSGYQQ